MFFDRDGIVNESPGGEYVIRKEDFHLTTEIPECLRIVAAHGYRAAVVTNQRGVGRGILAAAELEGIHAFMHRELERQGAPAFLDVIYCPHNPGECDCRKPQPGMLFTLAKRHGINLAGSWMIGDMATDVEAGRGAGCRTILVNPDQTVSRADYRLSSMAELPALLSRILDRSVQT